MRKYRGGINIYSYKLPWGKTVNYYPIEIPDNIVFSNIKNKDTLCNTLKVACNNENAWYIKFSDSNKLFNFNKMFYSFIPLYSILHDTPSNRMYIVRNTHRGTSLDLYSPSPYKIRKNDGTYDYTTYPPPAPINYSYNTGGTRRTKYRRNKKYYTRRR